MSIASIMTSVDLGPGAAERVRLAAGLAARFEATLTGIAARPFPAAGPIDRGVEIQAIADEGRARLADELRQVRSVFARGAGEGVRTAWQQGDGDPEGFLIRQSRGADLVMVSRRGPRDPDPGPFGVAPDRILMEAARPVLVVPPGLEHLRGARIVVAWKDTPEARRAVSAALPFIVQADQVFVATAGEGARFEGGQDVAELLARHGAHVTTHLLSAPPRETTDEILRFAARQDADLLVMGAYGHARLRQWLFGGATREILRMVPVCCLMSH